MVLLIFQTLMPYLNDYIPSSLVLGQSMHTGGYNPTMTVEQTVMVYEVSAALVEMTLFMDDLQRAAAVQDTRESRSFVLAKKQQGQQNYNISLQLAIATLGYLESFIACLHSWFEKQEYLEIPPEVL